MSNTPRSDALSRPISTFDRNATAVPTSAVRDMELELVAHDYYFRYTARLMDALSALADERGQLKLGVDDLAKSRELQDAYGAIRAVQEGQEAADPWVPVSRRFPPTTEPVVYRRPHPRNPRMFQVGIAYWTKSQKWNPEAESTQCPFGFTHWMNLP